MYPICNFIARHARHPLSSISADHLVFALLIRFCSLEAGSRSSASIATDFQWVTSIDYSLAKYTLVPEDLDIGLHPQL